MASSTLTRKKRTKDIQVEENADFEGLLLSDPILRAIRELGTSRPTIFPILSI